MWTDLIIERSILCGYPASQLLVSSGCADRLHLIEELRTYCKPRFPLHQCGFLFVLQVVQTIYTTFGTTEAATDAQIHNTDTAETFFGMPVPKVPAPNPSSFLSEHVLMDGLQWISTRQLREASMLVLGEELY